MNNTKKTSEFYDIKLLVKVIKKVETEAKNSTRVVLIATENVLKLIENTISPSFTSPPYGVIVPYGEEGLIEIPSVKKIENIDGTF